MRPILTIFTKTRKTFEYLDGFSNDKLTGKINLLLFFISIGIGYKFAIDVYELVENNIVLIFVLSIPFAGFIFIVMTRFLFTSMVWGLGRLLNGKAKHKDIQVAFAFSLTPLILKSIFLTFIVVIGIVKNDLTIINYNNYLIDILLSLLCLRIIIIGVSYYNKFSYGYALINILVLGVILEGLNLLIN